MSYDVKTLRGRRADRRFDRLSMGDIFERIRWSRPEKVVLTGYDGASERAGGISLTVAEADDMANRYAAALLAAGPKPGDIVLMACENSVEAVLAKIGMAKAGVIVAPVNPKLAADSVEELITRTGAQWAVLDAEFTDVFVPVFERTGIPVVTTIAIGGPIPAGHTDFGDFIRGASPSEPDTVIHGDDIWEILFTSGTSSLPKGVMVSHTKTMIESLVMSGAFTRGQSFESDMIMGGFLPVIYHVADITVFAAVLSGGSAVIGRRADPAALARAIDRHRITAVWAGAPQIVRGLDAALRAEPELDATSVTAIVHGFAPLPPETYRSLKQSLGPQVVCAEIIGQTEVCCAHWFWLDQHAELYERAVPQENYVGLPHPTMASAIMRPDGTIVPAGTGETGEAVYRSPAVMAGYWQNPQATEEAFSGGWFHGGDAFDEGEAGQRRLVDRFKDVIKTGGENVSSIRVESVLMQHPGVARAAVIGLRHPRWGEAVTAVIRADPERGCTEAEILDYAKGRLAGFETPKRAVFIEEFPVAVGDKIRKNKLREFFADLYAQEVS